MFTIINVRLCNKYGMELFKSKVFNKQFLYKMHISYSWILSVVIKKDEWLLRFAFSNYFYQLKYYTFFYYFEK